jgi:beta-glucosidase
VTVSLDLTHPGLKAEADAVNLLTGSSRPGVPRPIKELKGFSKVALEPGETKRVSVALNRRAFSYYDMKSKSWKADAGEFEILVGPSSARIDLKGKITLR